MDPIKKDEYKALYYIGLGLIVISMLLSDVMSLQNQFWIFGFAVGWIAAVWYIRYSIKQKKDHNIFVNLLSKIKGMLPDLKKIRK